MSKTPVTTAAATSYLRYQATMIEVKQRFRAIDRILGAKKPRTLTAAFDDEFMWLQLRKIVELVAFGGIMADEARYAALRAQAQDNPDYTRDWKVGAILKRLADITPYFLPRPIGDLHERPDGTKHFDAGKAVQTRERFTAIYEQAGEHLHAPNPFGEQTVQAHQARLASSREQLRVEVDYLKSVIWKHAKIGLEFDATVDAPRVAANPEWAWVVELGRPDDDVVCIITANASPPPNGPSASQPASTA